MEDFMLQLMNMSVQAAIAVGVVLIVRLLFVRFGVSKKYVGVLWLIPYLCMVCPWKLNSPIGFWESSPEEYQMERTRQAVIYIQNAVMPHEDDDVTLFAGADVSPLTDSVSSSVVADGIVQNFWIVSGGVWIAGILAILVYSVFSYIRLRKKLLCSVRAGEKIYLADDIDVPFVFGLFRTKIYLPSGMEDEYLQYVTEHERTHIRRRDPMKKFAAFCVTSIHWFNPFAWLAFSLFGRDMEMACDEETIEKIGADKRRDYADALLALSVDGRILTRAPLAFGEGDTESRIKNILRYKKTVWMNSTVTVLIVIALAVCFFTRRESVGDSVEDPHPALAGENQRPASAVEDSRTLANDIVQWELIEITPPHLDSETICGADGPLLDYADKRHVIFHDYFGLFVYDIEAQSMTGALDLTAIGCQYTQGDNFCEISVEDDGSRVYLHPLSEEDMYVYDVEKHMLTKRKYSMDGVQIFREMKLTGDCVNPDATVLRSYQCATLINDNVEDGHYLYLYLESGSGMAMDLCYVIGTTTGEQEEGRLFAQYDNSVNNDILENMDIREDVINANEISALGGIIEFAGEMTYSEFKRLDWTLDVDNSLAEDERLYVVKIYYPDGFEHNKAGRIENCEAIGLYRADDGEYLGGSFAERKQEGP